jgi:hypothetical protein
LDGSKPHGAKIFSLNQGELWIEALLPGEEGLSPSDPVSFQASSIEYIRALGPKASVVHLTSGLEIALSLPQPALLQKLQNPDDAMLDLKSLSYVEKRGMLLDRLREEFKKEAEAAKYAPLENLTFRAWVRVPNKADFREFEFSGRDVRVRDISEGGSIMGGTNMRFPLKEGANSTFGNGEFIIEGSLQELRAMCLEACARGDKELDLREYSLKKGTVLPADEAAKLQARKAPQP